MNTMPLNVADWGDLVAGREARDAGIKRAVDSAERKVAGWSDIAYGYLLEYLARHRSEFAAEQFRAWAELRGLEPPPHARAYGGVMVRGAHAGVIKRVGFVRVSNPKAHCATAALWRGL